MHIYVLQYRGIARGLTIAREILSSAFQNAIDETLPLALATHLTSTRFAL